MLMLNLFTPSRRHRPMKTHRLTYPKHTHMYYNSSISHTISERPEETKDSAWSEEKNDDEAVTEEESAGPTSDLNTDLFLIDL